MNQDIKPNSRKSDLRLIALIFGSVFALFLILTVLFVLTFKSKGTIFNAANPVKLFSSLMSKYVDTPTPSYIYSEPSKTYTNTTESTSTSESSDYYYTNEPTPAPTKSDYIYDSNINLWNTESSCIVYTIKSPADVASTGCYSQDDYTKLTQYVSNYQSAKYQKEWAETGMDITCDDKEFFKDACSDYRKALDKSEADITKYKPLILELIKKGK